MVFRLYFINNRVLRQPFTINQIKKAFSIETKRFIILKKWSLQESNQGHMDFQSIALPTELRDLSLIEWCKSNNFILISQIKSTYFPKYSQYY